jgi:hypothetical protein
MTHWVHRRLVDERTRDRNVRYVHVSLADNAHNLEPDYVAEMYAMKEDAAGLVSLLRPRRVGSFRGCRLQRVRGRNPRDRALPGDSGGLGRLPVARPRLQPPDRGPDLDRRRRRQLHHRPTSTSRPAWSPTTRPGCSATIRSSERRRSSPTRPSSPPGPGAGNRPGAKASVASEYVSQGIRLLEANNDRVAGYGRLRPRLPAIAESS